MPFCPECGKPVAEKAKFCRNCGASQIDSESRVAATPGPENVQVPVRTTEPVPPPHVPPVVAPAAPRPAEQQPASRFCGSCGVPVSGPTRFCGSCGAPVGTASPAGQTGPSVTAAAPAGPGGERRIGILRNAKKLKLLGASWDGYNIIITDRRMIFAQLTAKMLNAAIAEAQAKAKAEGKGFFDIWADQMSASFGFADRYLTMPPDRVLAETHGNFAIENSRITAVNLSLKNVGDEIRSSVHYHEFRMIVQSADGSYDYVIPEDDRFTDLLRRVYGERLHLPSGYTGKAGIRIKFF